MMASIVISPRIDAFIPATKRAVMTAASMAGGEAIRYARAEMTRQITARKAFKTGEVRDSLTIIYPSSKEVLVWRLRASNRAMPVFAFPGVRQTQQGVTVQIKAGQNAAIPHAFIATMKSGHRGVFIRTSKKRLPIRELYTSKIVNVFGDAVPAVVPLVQRKFDESFHRLLPLQVQRERF